ncbi:MAG: hypothetical protein Kow0040_02400 [Thermogutta sp.]
MAARGQKRSCLGVVVAIAATLTCGTGSERAVGSPPELRQGFVSPPDIARPAVYWCWLNGHVDHRQMTQELEEFQRNGIRGVYIFDIGARDPDNRIPAGPAFMGPESVKSIAHAVREARRLGLEVGLITSSSWNAGGPWVTPEYAAMGLFSSETVCEGPGTFDAELAFPELPASAPRDSQGRPLFAREVAVLAVPIERRRPAHEFIFEVCFPGRYIVDHAILCNTASTDPEATGPLHRFARDFEILISDFSDEPESFESVVRGRLEANTEPQRFDFPARPARFVKLRILDGHNPAQERIELGEFELYSTDGRNVITSLHEDGSRTGGKLLDYTSQLKLDGPWSASAIHDGTRSGPRGAWSSAGLPPPVVEDVARILDWSDRLDAGGRLRVEIPPGRYLVRRYVCANTGQKLVLPSPNSAGLAIDHFNPAATEWHFRHILEPLKAELGPLGETALKQMYVCSYELRGATWTPGFLEEFRRRRGYDMKRLLPVLDGCLVGDEYRNRRFLHDFRKTLGELLVDAFYRRASELSRAEGLLLCAEAGGPGLPLHQVPVDALQAQGAVDIPRGEFWKEHNIWVVKETAAAAHIYGKPLVDMEAFTSWRHWQDGPAELKPLADRAFCEGTNHFTFHTAAHRPPEVGLPGWVYTAGTHFSPHIAWWPMAGSFVEYLARSGFLLQQGRFVADVCYYYGDQGFNTVPQKHIDPSLGFGFDYDVVNAEVLLSRARVEGGRLTFGNGTSYAVLVLPAKREIQPEVLAKLAELVEQGLTVVGPRPLRGNSLSNYPQCDDRVRSLADILWGEDNGNGTAEHRYGAGRTVHGKPLRDILAEQGVSPDLAPVDGDEADIDFIHRSLPDAEVYFVWNRSPNRRQLVLTFRDSPGPPELWDPYHASIVPCLAYRKSQRGTTVPLSLPPHGSIFVVFSANASRASEDPIVSVFRDGKEVLFRQATDRDASRIAIQPGPDGTPQLESDQPGEYLVRFAGGREIAVRVEPGSETALSAPWTVRFPSDWGAPEEIVLDDLISWTEHPDPGVRYFSGMAVYQTEFSLPEGDWHNRSLVLSLGDVRSIGEVWLNEKPLATLWTPPFEVDLSSAARPGKNRLTIRVANTWSNRLVGDALGVGDRKFTETNMPYSISWRVAWKDTPLIPSGVIGPALLQVRYRTPIR